MTKSKNILKTKAKNNGYGFYNVNPCNSIDLDGFAKLLEFDIEHIEVRYPLLKKHWGSGYGSEITEKLVKYVKKCFPEKVIIAIVYLNNEASKNVLLIQKFTLEEVEDLHEISIEFYKRNELI